MCCAVFCRTLSLWARAPQPQTLVSCLTSSPMAAVPVTTSPLWQRCLSEQTHTRDCPYPTPRRRLSVWLTVSEHAVGASGCVWKLEGCTSSIAVCLCCVGAREQRTSQLAQNGLIRIYICVCACSQMTAGMLSCYLGCGCVSERADCCVLGCFCDHPPLAS